MAKRRPLADEDGNLLPPLDPKSGISQIIYLLEYGRLRGFKIGPTVQVGDTIVQVRDLEQEKELSGDPSATQTTIWQEHGHDDTKG